MTTTTTQIPVISEVMAEQQRSRRAGAFQSSHFGDDTKPEVWFVDAQTALHFDAPPAPQEDDLGHYEDGTKRTLTDEQIAMFRNSEIQKLLRERRLRREESDYQNRDPDEDVREAPRSPVSDASSIEADLVGLARPAAQRKTRTHKQKQRVKRKKQEKLANSRQPSQSSRSDTPQSTSSSRQPRRQEVPYDQRNKRKWENFIDANDPVEGSLTHRRIVRQLDDAKDAEVDVDYGEADTSAKALPDTEAQPSGRRLVSYDDA
ncbi:hypothetical protein LTR22_002813 [Elasticomyces elasticus]|nr:hypothetical protein LTR22_002813 [Elasticomyces elasticus]KAK4910364.1 hypothetical protein LTR49_020971 [Elasticomyces elasticus]KAK5740858.1 hypothetical protein LTS12_024807 [Elasticomyces elasticus]